MRSKHNPFVSSIAIIASVIAITMVQSVSADTGTWIGAFDGTWDTTDTNWSDVTGTAWNVSNGPNNNAIFNTASLAAVVSGPVFTNGITFSTTGALSGSTIVLAGGTPSISIATGTTGTISSTVAGSSLTKLDLGLLKLSNATYTGGTTVSEGRLVLENTKTGSSNYTTNSELEFNLTTGDQQLISGTISGTGRLVKTGANTLTLSDWSGNQTVALTGPDSVIDIQAGKVAHFFAAGAFGPVVDWTGNEAGLIVASGAVFDLFENSVTVDEINGAGTINKDAWDQAITLTVGVSNGSGTFSGSILNPKNSLAIVKKGNGTQTLSGAAILYKGGTTVSAGRLVLENTKSGSNSYTIDAELEFKLNAGNQQLQSGTISGTGSLIKTGVNELIFSNWGGAQTVSLTGANSVIDVQAGTLSNHNDAAFGAPPTVWTNNKAGLTVASGAIFQINNTSAIVDELNGAGTIVKNKWDTAVTLTIGVNNGSGTFSGALSQTVGTNMSLIKQGSGTQTLSSINTYVGATTVSAGTLALVGGSQTSPITVAGGASLGFTIGSPTTSTAAVNLTAGTVAITGTANNTSDYQLMTAASFTGPFNLTAAIPGYQLQARSSGTQLWLARVSDPYLAWAGPGVNFDADANNDGVANGLAWLLGASSPNVSALDKLPLVAKLPGGGLQLTFNMLPSSARGVASLTLQQSSDLGISDPWASVIVPDTTGGSAPATFVVSGTNPLTVVGTVSSSEAAGGKLFGRLRANR